jgi:hypothetical protein
MLPGLTLLVMIGMFYSRSLWVMLLAIILLSMFSLGIKTYRAIFLSLKEAPYIEAARTYGAGSFRIIFRYMIPRVIPMLIPAFVTAIPGFVFLEASLSILGLGDPDIPTWGKLLFDAYANEALFKGYYYWVLEPAALLMIKPETVKTRLHRARKLMRASQKRCRDSQTASTLGRMATACAWFSSWRSEVKYWSSRCRSWLPSCCCRRSASSCTAERTLWRSSVCASGTNGPPLGSMNPGPKTRVYSSSGETVLALTMLSLARLYVCPGTPVAFTSSERKRVAPPMRAEMRTSSVGAARKNWPQATH